MKVTVTKRVDADLAGNPGVVLGSRFGDTLKISFDDGSYIEAPREEVVPYLPDDEIEIVILRSGANGLFQEGYKKGLVQGEKFGKSTMSYWWFPIVLVLTNLFTAGALMMVFWSLLQPS